MTVLRVSRRMLLASALAAPLAARAQSGETSASDAAEAAGRRRRPEPANTVTVGLADFHPEPFSGLLHASTPASTASMRRRMATAEPDDTPEGRLLAVLVRRGEAAGHDGDLYDNRDRGHSNLPIRRHPLTTFVRYAEDMRARGLDYGVNSRLLFDRPTVGNASLAVTRGPHRRSLPRAAMTEGQPTMARLSALYRANHLYVYPAHRDHDAERGDRFPAVTPHYVISQGSSRSDRPIVSAFVLALAGLRPDTKQRLTDRGLVAPTLQALLRRSMTGVETEADYLSPVAHPTVFDAARIDRERILRAANALTPDAPPAPRIAVVAEPTLTPGVDLLGDGLSERLYDTPEAAARLAHGVGGLRRYRLEASVDGAAGRVRFLWRVLRGPGARVTPLDANGAKAEATIPWTDVYPTPETGLATSRVDVALFAEIGGALSAPAFFSVAFPADRRGEWAADGRPLVIDHMTAAPESYVDPALFPRRDWRDVYRYDGDGRLLGWTRERPDGARQAFTRHGLRVVAEDGRGRPLRAEAVGYPGEAHRDGRPRIVEEGLGRFFAYAYADEADLMGVALPTP